jgi:hypothetical protein
MFKKKISTVAVAGLVLALAVVVMFLGAPMAANAGVLQSDDFSGADIDDTSFETWDDFAEVNTGTEELDILGGSRKGGIFYYVDAGTTTGTDSAVWTFSLDVRAVLVAFDNGRDGLKDGLIKIPLIGEGGNLAEIYIEQDGSDMTFSMDAPAVGEIASVTTGLAQNTWYHIDLVLNRTGSEVIYNGTDVAANKADLWIDGEIAIYGIDTTDDGPDHAGLLEAEFEGRYGGETGSIDNWVIRDEAYVVSEPELGPPTWTTTGLGDWNDAANWNTTAAPNGNIGEESNAVFGSDITADTTVVANTAVTVNAITFDNANRYLVAGAGSVTVDDGVGFLASIEVVQGTHEFQLPVTMGSDVEITVAAGSELIFNNALNLGGFVHDKLGDGLLTINNIVTTGGGEITVYEGSIGGNGVVGGDLVVDATVAPGNSIGTLSVGGNLTLVSDSVYEWEIGEDGTDVIDLTGGNGGVVLGDFILKILDAGGDVADASVQLPVFTYDQGTAVDMAGFGNDAASFDVTDLDETWTVGDLTLTDDGSGVIYLTGLISGVVVAVDGDANGDLDVDAADLAILKAQFGGPWSGVIDADPDFDNDGLVTLADFALLRANWGAGPGGAPEIGDLTPEPATMTMLALGGLGVLARRRRRT